MLLQISNLFVLHFLLLTFICAFAALLCCCFFFFFYFVTNTKKQLKNNNIKKYRKPRRTCWTEREFCCCFVFLCVLNHFLFVFLLFFSFFVENFEFWFCVRDARNNFVSLSPDRSPVSSLLFQPRFSMPLKITYFCCCCFFLFFISFWFLR